MANILFTWELGAGSGHVAPYVNLVDKLSQQGHKIFYAMKFLNQAEQLFKGMDVNYFQAPGAFNPNKYKVRKTNSYARIIHNSGFNDIDHLTALVKAWQNLYALIKPDVIIFDYSPTAMLAARNNNAKKIAVGTGFHLPPDVTPIPDFSSELGKEMDVKDVINFETYLLKNINQVASKTKIEPLTQLSHLYATDLTILRTYREMDHYHHRKNGTYSGVLKSASGLNPEWPEQKGKKIFAYLKPFKTLSDLLKLLNESKLPVLIYGDGIGPKMKKEYSSKTLQFAPERLDMQTIGETADIAICNAGHSACCELLLSGVPMLLLPLYLEQHLVANNVAALGAGISAPNLVPKGMQIKFNMLLENDKYRDAAQAFAKKYSDNSTTPLADQLAEAVNSLL